MSDETTGKSGKTWLYVVGWLASLLLVYVLSLGPVFVLAVRKALPEEVLNAYAPVGWVVDATDTKAMLLAYLNVWCQTTKTDIPWLLR